jgi:quercetin dioxygenase-like cupin family protein
MIERKKGGVVSKAGDVYENPVTGERVVIRVGKEESGGELVITDLYVSPGGAVAGEHVHPDIEETFTMVRGRVGFQLDWREENARLGERLHVPGGMAYDWWNAGDYEAHVVVELRADAPRLERFEMMISMLYGMARDGKTDAKGRPNLFRTRSSPKSLMTSSASSSRRDSCRRSCSARSCPWRTSCVLGFAVTAYGPDHGLPGAVFLAAGG